MAGLVRKVESIARAQGVERVVRVDVQVDAWTSLTRSHLKDNFVLAARGTVVEGAQLVVVQGSEGNDSVPQGLFLVSMEVED